MYLYLDGDINLGGSKSLVAAVINCTGNDMKLSLITLANHNFQLKDINAYMSPIYSLPIC